MTFFAARNQIKWYKSLGYLDDNYSTKVSFYNERNLNKFGQKYFTEHDGEKRQTRLVLSVQFSVILGGAA